MLCYPPCLVEVSWSDGRLHCSPFEFWSVEISQQKPLATVTMDDLLQESIYAVSFRLAKQFSESDHD